MQISTNVVNGPKSNN